MRSSIVTHRSLSRGSTLGILTIIAVLLQGCCCIPKSPTAGSCPNPRDNDAVGTQDRVVDDRITMIGYYSGDPNVGTQLEYAEPGCRLRNRVVRDAGLPGSAGAPTCTPPKKACRVGNDVVCLTSC